MYFARLIVILGLACPLFQTPAAQALEKCLVLDLDSTLVHHLAPTTTFKSVERAQKYQEEGRIIPKVWHKDSPSRDYLLYEGATEFLQWIAENTDFKIRFFSSATEPRNRDLIWKYLHQISNQPAGADMPDFKIFSKHHVVKRTKNLQAIGCDPATSILMDDKENVSSPYEKDNLLKTNHLSLEAMKKVVQPSLKGIYNHIFDPFEKPASFHQEFINDLGHFYYLTTVISEVLKFAGADNAIPETLSIVRGFAEENYSGFMEEGKILLQPYGKKVSPVIWEKWLKDYGVMTNPGLSSTEK